MRSPLRLGLVVLSLLTLGCSGSNQDSEGGFLPSWGPGQGSGSPDTGRQDAGGDDTGGVDDTGVDDTGDTNPKDTGERDTGDTGPAPGTKDNPRVARSGELVLAELMIAPDGSSDSDGEWVEIDNSSSDWLDLSGCSLRDEGGQSSGLSASETKGLILGPGKRLVLCANDDTWDNGSVDCQGTYSHSKFNMSTGSDEAVIYCSGMVDRVRWGSGWAATGSSMGVDGGKVSAGENDDLGNWCEQRGFLSNGDYGNPGSDNDWCF